MEVCIRFLKASSLLAQATWVTLRAHFALSAPELHQPPPHPPPVRSLETAPEQDINSWLGQGPSHFTFPTLWDQKVRGLLAAFVQG